MPTKIIEYCRENTVGPGGAQGPSSAYYEATGDGARCDQRLVSESDFGLIVGTTEV